MKAPNLFIQNAHLTYKNVVLFENLNLTLTAEKCTCLLGQSGVGKTSLLHLLANLIAPGTDVQGNIFSSNDLPLNTQISYMAQSDSLMPWLTALENVLLSVTLTGQEKAPFIQKAHDLLEKMGLKADMHKYPSELSGGMKQRVALARTWIQDKPIILMDEPFSALDALTRLQLQNMAAEFLKNRTSFLVTHDPLEALRLADEIYILSGRPAQLSKPLILTTPKPRDPGDLEFIKHQGELFQALMGEK